MYIDGSVDKSILYCVPDEHVDFKQKKYVKFTLRNPIRISLHTYASENQPTVCDATFAATEYDARTLLYFLYTYFHAVDNPKEVTEHKEL